MTVFLLASAVRLLIEFIVGQEMLFGTTNTTSAIVLVLVLINLCIGHIAIITPPLWLGRFVQLESHWQLIEIRFDRFIVIDVLGIARLIGRVTSAKLPVFTFIVTVFVIINRCRKIALCFSWIELIAIGGRWGSR